MPSACQQRRSVYLILSLILVVTLLLSFRDSFSPRPSFVLGGQTAIRSYPIQTPAAVDTASLLLDRARSHSGSYTLEDARNRNETLEASLLLDRARSHSGPYTLEDDRNRNKTLEDIYALLERMVSKTANDGPSIAHSLTQSESNRDASEDAYIAKLKHDLMVLKKMPNKSHELHVVVMHAKEMRERLALQREKREADKREHKKLRLVHLQQVHKEYAQGLQKEQQTCSLGEKDTKAAQRFLILEKAGNMPSAAGSARPTDREIIECVMRRGFVYANRLLLEFREDSNFYHDDMANFEKVEDVYQRRQDANPHEYKGQGHEGGIDRFVSEYLLPRMCKGRFFEMGAWDGREGSVSFSLEHQRLWTGVMVEANKALFEVARKNRPNAVLHNVAIDAVEGYMTRQVSFGATMKPQCSPQPPSAEQLKEQSQYQARVQQEHSHLSNQDTVLGIRCSPIHAILDGDGAFDWVSLDCEGCEKAALTTWDFRKNPVGVLSLEMWPDADMTSILRAEGFSYLGKLGDHIWFIPAYVYEANSGHWLTHAEDGRPSGYCGFN